MAAPSWSHLLALLLVSAGLAGCTDRTGGDTGEGEAGPAGGDTGAPPGQAAAPTPFELTDSGTITGPFSESWAIEVENVGFTSAMVHFTLSGAQAGTPATARVNLVLNDPDGAPVRSAIVGLGGEGNAIEWSFTPADLPTAGTYTLTATSGDGAPLPSAGLANYELMAMVDY